MKGAGVAESKKRNKPPVKNTSGFLIVYEKSVNFLRCPCLFYHNLSGFARAKKSKKKNRRIDQKRSPGIVQKDRELFGKPKEERREKTDKY
ncbi:MAG: hypothetical protein J6Z04_03655 [Clostridia bacterium]|nr:hypothetical protein [Clostridia bacterium]